MDNLQCITLLAKTYHDLDIKIDQSPSNMSRITLYVGTSQGNTLGIRIYYDDVYYFEAVLNDKRILVDFNVQPVLPTEEIGLYHADTFDNLLGYFKCLQQKMSKYFSHFMVKERLITAYDPPKYLNTYKPLIRKYKHLVWHEDLISYRDYKISKYYKVFGVSFIEGDALPFTLTIHNESKNYIIRDIYEVMKKIEQQIPNLELNETFSNEK